VLTSWEGDRFCWSTFQGELGLAARRRDARSDQLRLRTALRRKQTNAVAAVQNIRTSQLADPRPTARGKPGTSCPGRRMVGLARTGDQHSMIDWITPISCIAACRSEPGRGDE